MKDKPKDNVIQFPDMGNEGSIIDEVMGERGITFSEAVLVVARNLGLPVDGIDEFGDLT